MEAAQGTRSTAELQSIAFPEHFDDEGNRLGFADAN